MQSTYQSKIQAQTITVKKLKRISNVLSALRLIAVATVIVCLYQLIVMQNTHAIWQNLSVIAVFCFVILLMIYQRNSKKLAYHNTLLALNQNEFSYLNESGLAFENGDEFTDNAHPHSFDLDLFGEKSLFHHINRTQLSLGKKYLAQLLTVTPNSDEVVNRQKAVNELSQRIEFRQHFSVLATLSQDNEKHTENLKKWTKKQQPIKKQLTYYLAYMLPIIFMVLAVLYFIDNSWVNPSWIGYLFMINLFTVGFNYKSISQELNFSSKSGAVLFAYASLVKAIHESKFNAPLLKKIQEELTIKGESAEKNIKKISRLFNQLDTVANMFVFILFNGIFQFHNHVYYRMQKWKSDYKKDLLKWMDAVAEIEAYISLANFSYNNPDYNFPSINNDYEYYFRELGHPLIMKNKRVCNDIDFRQQRLTVLTGSNMSGKSTFLRTIGVNLILAYAGAPICASKATISPIPLWVSMRLTDSLNEGESYFYAEVKRLKNIVLKAENQRIFILLDEILRGTNSDDKTQGTIGVVKKMINCEAIGVIATHDLEVCSVENLYPKLIKNRSFEGLILDGGLHFDYKLREGICQNKNATFIMQKMGII